MIKNIKVKLFLLALAVNALTIKSAFGQSPLDRLKNTAKDSGYSTQSVMPQAIAVTVITYVLGFVGIIFLVVTLVSGFQWMTSGGNEEKISEAKKRLQYAIIGLIVILASYAITIFVSRSLINATTQSYYSPY